MPDPDSRKSQQKKGKHEAKEQRKPRQQRNQPGEKRPEKKHDEPKVAVPEKPAYEEPGPEFYKVLKRETDEILKITEEANSKYKKKEIQSNWAKYEVPIESYDEVEEHENMGADYEKLIEAPLSIGGHFQFKHEKSWDMSTASSLYDKYFEINMNELATALCTIPFYERNSIDTSIFSETDINNMDHRTTRYKHKYYKIATAESELQDKLIKSLKEDCTKTEESAQDSDNSDSEVLDKSQVVEEISFDNVESNKPEVVPEIKNEVEIVFKRPQDEYVAGALGNQFKPKLLEDIDNIDDIILGTKEIAVSIIEAEVNEVKTVSENKLANKVPTPAESKKNPVIESPEDLEKWLDDFLE